MADDFTKSVVRIGRIIFIMGVVNHFVACIWVLAGRMADRKQRDAIGDTDCDDRSLFGSWLNNDLHYYCYRDTESGNKVMSIYLASYYFGFTTMTTVGYGDVHPWSETERVFLIFFQVSGGFIMAWVIATLTSIVTTEDANVAAMNARLDAVASYLTRMKVPQDLGRRIRRNFRHYLDGKSSLDERSILMGASTALRGELTDYLVEHGHLKDVILFKSMSTAYWARILPLLRPCLFTRDESICLQGEDCVEAYFLTSGCLTGATVLDPIRTAFGRSKVRKTTSFALRANEMAEVGAEEKLLVHKSRATAIEPAALLRIKQFHTKVAQELHPGDRQPGTFREAERAGARVSRASHDEAPDVAMDLDQRLRLRVIAPGGLINVLACLKVWNRCLETVRATEKADCYALNADAFFAEFKDDPAVLTKMQEHMTETQFFMGPTEPGCPTAYGVPFFVLNEAESVEKQAEWDIKERGRRRKRAADTAVALRNHHEQHDNHQQRSSAKQKRPSFRSGPPRQHHERSNRRSSKGQ